MSSFSQALPVHMTLVGCYSTNERLIDCTYHDFSSLSYDTTSMDVSISCGSDSADKDSAGMSDDEDDSATESDDNDDSTDNDSNGSADVDSTAIDSAGAKDEPSSVSVASLSVAVICASALIILVAVLIIMYMFRQSTL